MSQLNNVMRALNTRWLALAVTGGTLADAQVFLGPPVTPASTMDLVIVGDEGGSDDSDQSSFEQEWADLGHTRRNELGEIICSVISSSGSTDMLSRIDRADALLTACEDSLRADPTLGGIVANAELVRASGRSLQNTGGAAVVTPFTVRYFVQV
jgi:hypothetical protein